MSNDLAKVEIPIEHFDITGDPVVRCKTKEGLPYIGLFRFYGNIPPGDIVVHNLLNGLWKADQKSVRAGEVGRASLDELIEHIVELRNKFSEKAKESSYDGAIAGKHVVYIGEVWAELDRQNKLDPWNTDSYKLVQLKCEPDSGLYVVETEYGVNSDNPVFGDKIAFKLTNKPFYQEETMARMILDSFPDPTKLGLAETIQDKEFHQYIAHRIPEDYFKCVKTAFLMTHDTTTEPVDIQKDL